MTDLHERFKVEFENVPVPELWDRIETIAAAPSAGTHRAISRFAVAAVAAVVMVTVVGGPIYLIGPRHASEATPEPAAVAKTWEPERVDLPTSGSVLEVVELPTEGFAAIARNPTGVFWSPDGIDWYDIDPKHQVTPYVPLANPQLNDRAIAATASRIIIRDKTNAGLWIGDWTTGRWERVSLDVGDGPGQVMMLDVAANDSEALAVAQIQDPQVRGPVEPEGPESVPYTRQYLAWIVNPTDGTANSYSLPIPAPEWAEHAEAFAGWFNGQWLAVVGREVSTDTDQGWTSPRTILMSPDGMLWTGSDAPFSSTSIAIGPNSLVATECNFGGNTSWFSADGVEWTATRTGSGHESTHIDGVGFATRYGMLWMLSTNGRDWQYPRPAAHHLRPLPRKRRSRDSLPLWRIRDQHRAVDLVLHSSNYRSRAGLMRYRLGLAMTPSIRNMVRGHLESATYTLVEAVETTYQDSGAVVQWIWGGAYEG